MRWLGILAFLAVVLAACSTPSRYTAGDAWAICPGPDVEIVKVTETPEQIQAGFASFKLAQDVHAAAYTLWLRGCVCEIHVPPPNTDNALHYEEAEIRHCHEGLYHD